MTTRGEIPLPVPGAFLARAGATRGEPQKPDTRDEQILIITKMYIDQVEVALAFRNLKNRAINDLAKAKRLLRKTHPLHPQPTLCPACRYLGRK